MLPTIQPPAPRPCESCPYRRDVPSGLWDRAEYDKLPRYDADTPAQPDKLFLCHQTGLDQPTARICAGWAGCHDGEHLLALRYALAQDRISPTTYQAATSYISAVPLFASGSDAAAHGLVDVNNPGPDARRLLAKLGRVRSDLIYRQDDHMATFRVPIQLQHPVTADGRFETVADFTVELFDHLGVFAPITPSADLANLAEGTVTQLSERDFVAEVTLTAASVAIMMPAGHATAGSLEAFAEEVVARALRELGYNENTAAIDTDAITITEPTPSA